MELKNHILSHDNEHFEQLPGHFFNFFLVVEKFCQVLCTCQSSDQLDHNTGGGGQNHTNLQKAQPV